MYGRHPRLPVDMIFGLSTEEEATFPRRNAEKRAQRMKEAYRLNIWEQATVKFLRKRHYDRHMKGVVLEPGLCPGKKSEWERGPQWIKILLETQPMWWRREYLLDLFYKVTPETSSNTTL